MNENPFKKIHESIAKSDPERLNGYIGMLDKILLYTLVVNAMPKELIEDTINKWEKTIKTSIDMESCRRTNFLESTPQGRLEKQKERPDGEDLRLLYLETLNTAKQLVAKNLSQNEDDEFDFESESP